MLNDIFTNYQIKDIITKYMRGFNFKIRISDKDTEGITLEDYKNKWQKKK